MYGILRSKAMVPGFGRLILTNFFDSVLNELLVFFVHPLDPAKSRSGICPAKYFINLDLEVGLNGLGYNQPGWYG